MASRQEAVEDFEFVSVPRGLPVDLKHTNSSSSTKHNTTSAVKSAAKHVAQKLHLTHSTPNVGTPHKKEPKPDPFEDQPLIEKPKASSSRLQTASPLTVAFAPSDAQLKAKVTELEQRLERSHKTNKIYASKLDKLIGQLTAQFVAEMPNEDLFYQGVAGLKEVRDVLRGVILPEVDLNQVPTFSEDITIEVSDAQPGKIQAMTEDK